MTYSWVLNMSDKKKLPVSEEGHVHGPGCNHDHGHEHAHDHDHGHKEEEHEHGPGCEHDHDHGHSHDHDHDHKPKYVERPPGSRPAETGGAALQLDLEGVLPGESDDQGRFQKLQQAVEGTRGVSEVHLRKDLGYNEVCIHFDKEQTSASHLMQLVRAMGGQVAERYKQGTWFVRNMESAQCSTVIEYSLNRMPGILSANVAYAAERVVIEYDSDSVKTSDIFKRVKALGYELEEPMKGHACSHSHHSGGLAPKLEMPLAITSGVLIALGVALHYGVGESTATISTVCYLLALAAGGFFPVQSAFKSLLQIRADIESLTVLAGFGAAILGEYFEGALLLFLFSLGHAFEHRALDRARRAIEALGKLRPTVARIKKGSELVEVPVKEVKRGDIMVIRAGDRVPLDGKIIDGQTSFEQAAITGESVPVAKGPGDSIFAGSVNADQNNVEAEVTKLSSESVLAKVVDMVAEAEAQKGPSQRFAYRIEKTFVPLVLLGAALLPVVFYLLGTAGVIESQPLKEYILRSIAILVAASPCALAISTPAAVLSAVARGARSGVLIKGGAHIESLGNVKAIAFDKTGTLTHGKPSLVSVFMLDGVTEEELLSISASAESLSGHPLAKAVVDGAKAKGYALRPAKNMQSVHGKGLRANVDGQMTFIGNIAMFAGDEIPEIIVKKCSELEDAGQTTMIVKRGPKFLGALGVADTVREDAKESLAQLAKLGIKKTVMLSGDNLRVAKAISAQVGITEPRAPLLPEGKVAALKELSKSGGVAMVGDGVNDAPALAAASVGIAMGGVGSDVAMETADIVLLRDDLKNLPFAVSLARKATQTIKQNLFVSLGVSVFLIIASVAGFAGISESVVLHEGSTLVVVINGLWLLRFKG
jgi:Cd2+/Zn2+-exporting ATPase